MFFDQSKIFFRFFSSLSKLTSLTDLNLSGNNIQSLPQTALLTMENLQVLCLHSNQLRAIPDLRRLNSLKVNRGECKGVSDSIVCFRYWI
jgi:Leucine-rich repeat (LRR) protein